MVGSRTAGSGSKDLIAELVAHLWRPEPDAGAGDTVTAVQRCFAEVARDCGRESAAAIGIAAARWAREGVALETVLTACHDSARTGFDYLAARMSEAAARGDAIADAVRLLARAVDLMTTAAATAYVDEHRIVAREHQTAAQTMVAALLSGHGVNALAKRSGFRIAPAYQVAALSLPPHADESAGGPESQSAARRKLRRVQAALGAPLGSQALSLLRADGGTVLVPLESAPTVDKTLAVPVLNAEVLRVVAESAEVRPTAVVAAGPIEQVPELAGRVHEVLDQLGAHDRSPGLYRIVDDSDVEADLSGPDSGRLHRLPWIHSGPRSRPGTPGAA